MIEEGQKTPEERIGALEDIAGTILDMLEKLTKKVEDVDKRAVKKSAGLFGGKRTKTAIKDTQTGVVYASKAQMGKKLAAEFGLDPGNNFVYYQIILKAPDRFVDASEEEAKKVWAEEEVQRAKEVEEANKRLAAEQKAQEAKPKKK